MERIQVEGKMKNMEWLAISLPLHDQCIVRSIIPRLMLNRNVPTRIKNKQAKDRVWERDEFLSPNRNNHFVVW